MAVFPIMNALEILWSGLLWLIYFVLGVVVFAGLALLFHVKVILRR